MVLNYTFFIEAIGWIGTLALVFSYIVKTRKMLHVIAFVSTCLKLYYCYVHAVWPLFANWAALFFVHIAKIYQIIGEERLEKKLKLDDSKQN